MSDLKSLLKQRGMTNAHVRLMNWAMLAIIVVEGILCFYVGGVSRARSIVLSSTGTYVLLLLLIPPVFRWMHPGVPVERKGAWLVGVAGYGGLSLGLWLWMLAPLFR